MTYMLSINYYDFPLPILFHACLLFYFSSYISLVEEDEILSEEEKDTTTHDNFSTNEE